MKQLLISLIAYLIGAIPFGLIFSRLKGVDPRLSGSGNIGATNVFRTAGPLPALLTLVFDISKGGIAVLIAKSLSIEPSWIAGLGAIIGHMFPVYLKFKGGKGVATTLGTFMALSPLGGTVIIAIWLVVAFITRYSSAAAILSIGLSPLVFSLLGDDMILFTVLVAPMVIFKHRDNIKRLLNGTEKKIGERAVAILLGLLIYGTILCFLTENALAQDTTNSNTSNTLSPAPLDMEKIRSIQENALDRGLLLPEFVSLYVFKKQNISDKDLIELINLDRGLPQNYFMLSEHYFRKGIKDSLFEGLPSIINGITIAGHDPVWLGNLILLVLIISMLSLIFGIIITGIFRLPVEIPLLIHEATETRLGYIFPGVLILSAIAGIPYFATAVLAITALHAPSRATKISVALSCIFLLLLPIMIQIQERFITVLSNPEFRAVRDVNVSRDNRLVIVRGIPEADSQLTPSQGFILLFSKALALKREGNLEQAIEILKRLSETRKDYRVFNNLGNCLFLKGNIDEAVEYYQKAIRLKNNPQSLYNLSQAYREKLDFEKARQYYEEAIKLNGDLIAWFTRISSRSPNRFLMDITLDAPEILKFGISKIKSGGGGFFKESGLQKILWLLMPVGLLGLLFIQFPVRAYRCSRCRKIICNVCQRKELWGKMCPECYEVLVTPDKIDSKTRLQRLLYLQKKKTLRNRLLWLISVIPGAPQIIYGWIFTGLLITTLSGAAITLALTGQFYLIETLKQSYLTGILIGGIAILIHLYTLRRVSRVWA